MSEHTSRLTASRASRLAAAGIVASALFMGMGGTGATAAPNPHVAVAGSVTVHQAAKPKPKGRDLGPCWAQAGRVVGGLWGAIYKTVSGGPVGAVAGWASYGAAMAKEKKDKNGNFIC